MTFVQPPLPYTKDALDPYMSALTLGHHYDEHHRGYVAALNVLTRGKKWEKMCLRDVVLETENDVVEVATYQNAAQAWNHEFFWHSMTPDGGPKADGELFERIVADFGSVDAFESEFSIAAAKQFGSGWVWLVEQESKLKVMATGNAMPAFVSGARPLLVCDVWEHAYYLDHYSDRKGFVQTFLTQLANWDVALLRLKSKSNH